MCLDICQSQTLKEHVVHLGDVLEVALNMYTNRLCVYGYWAIVYLQLRLSQDISTWAVLNVSWCNEFKGKAEEYLQNFPTYNYSQILLLITLYMDFKTPLPHLRTHTHKPRNWSETILIRCFVCLFFKKTKNITGMQVKYALCFVSKSALYQINPYVL